MRLQGETSYLMYNTVITYTVASVELHKLYIRENHTFVGTCYINCVQQTTYYLVFKNINVLILLGFGTYKNIQKHFDAYET